MQSLDDLKVYDWYNSPFEKEEAFLNEAVVAQAYYFPGEFAIKPVGPKHRLRRFADVTTNMNITFFANSYVYINIHI